MHQNQGMWLKACQGNALFQVQKPHHTYHISFHPLAVVNGMALARTLGDMPSNICTPTYLAQTAQALAKEFGLDCVVLEESDMSALGMGSLLSVSKGSIESPKLISLSYQGKGNAKPIVLVGKGVTFDSGGISLKPGAGMDEMKYDMSTQSSPNSFANACAVCAK
jgi:leucyl aminopeptidase